MRTYTYTVTTARFLSPDPYVQSPTYSQNYNRYSYCLNNPLKYNDPSGYKWKWWQTALGIGMLIDPVSTTATAFAGWSSVENTIIAAGATYTAAIASIPIFQSTMQATDYGVQSIKSTIYMIQDIGGKNYDQDDTWIFKGMINSIKMDMAAVFHIPGWESEQATLGNGISHFRNMIGKVDDVTIDWGRLTCLVNDVDGSDTDHQWGFTLGPYINSYNINSTSDNMYKHESGHTMQSRLIGPLFLSRVGLPSMISCELINQGDGYHDHCWYEVWANNIGGAKKNDDYPKSYRKTSFGYWFKTIVFPFYPN